MKRLLIMSVLFVCGAFSVKGYSASTLSKYPATSTGSVTCINVSTVPAVILSTGTRYEVVGNLYLNTSSTSIAGTYMPYRAQLEIFNGSSEDIYIGYNAKVSSVANTPLLGRKIAAGSAWSHDCSILEHWAVAGSSTGFNVVITQEK